MSPRQLQTTIENPTLELKIVSASDVTYFDATDKIDVYAVISINGDNTQKKQSAKTPIDYDGGSKPTWNHTVKFSFNEEKAREGLLNVHVKLYSYWLEEEDDLYLGEVNVSVKELLALDPFDNGNVKKMKSVTYPIKLNGEIKPNAKLSLLYRFKPVPVNDLYPPPPPSQLDYLPQPVPVYTNPDPARSGQQIIYSPQFQTTGQTNTVTKLALELVIKSANNIRNVNVFDDMDVYASVMIYENKTTVKHKTKTPVAYSGFIFPTWNHAVKFTFDEDELARKDNLSLVVKLMSHRPLIGDKHIGKVNVPILELLSLNAPSPLSDVNVNKMKLVTRKVSVPNGLYGTLSFTYRFLEEQVTTHQPFIMYIPVPNPVHGTSGYMAVQSGANVGPSNGVLPIYMPTPYQPNGYQQHSLPQTQTQTQPQPQPQLRPQKSQPQQHLPNPLVGLQSESQFYESHGNHQNSPSKPQPQTQPPPPYGPTQSQAQPQEGSTGALGLGAAVLGRVIGGALMSGIMSDEINIYEVEA